MNKKAQAQIITTVLIILLVLAAIVIVWQVIQGYAKSGSEEFEKKSACALLVIEMTNIVKDEGCSATVTGIDCNANKATCMRLATDTPPGCGGTWTSGSVTIRPDRDIGDHRVFVNGNLVVESGGAVSAVTTKTTAIEKLRSRDNIEIFGNIDGTWCTTGPDEDVQ